MTNDSLHSYTSTAETLWFTEKEAARRLNMSVKWLQKQRLCGGGIPFAKFGSAVRYSLSHIQDYERASLRQNTSQTFAVKEAE